MNVEQKKFILFVLFLGLVVVAILAWSIQSYNADAVNAYYGKGFSDRGVSHGQSQSSDSQQNYHPSGLREADIPKHHGRRYDTY